MTKKQAVDALERVSQEAAELRDQIRAGGRTSDLLDQEDQVRHRLAHALGRIPDQGDTLDGLLRLVKRNAEAVRVIRESGGQLRQLLADLAKDMAGAAHQDHKA